MCFQRGQAKCTYGTGCFLLYNTGTAVRNFLRHPTIYDSIPNRMQEQRILLQIMESSHGLLTTVAYQLGAHASPVYALEGSVAIAGAVVQWLKDNLQTIRDPKECESIVEQISVSNRGQIVFVPAFTGLYAPYWRKDARGLLIELILSEICHVTPRDV